MTQQRKPKHLFCNTVVQSETCGRSATDLCRLLEQSLSGSFSHFQKGANRGQIWAVARALASSCDESVFVCSFISLSFSWQLQEQRKPTFTPEYVGPTLQTLSLSLSLSLSLFPLQWNHLGFARLQGFVMFHVEWTIFPRVYHGC